MSGSEKTGRKERRGALRIAVCLAAGTVIGQTVTDPAFAATPAVSVPHGPFQDAQVITVSGSGFPTHAHDPSGLQIIECSDPGGSSANLPTDATVGCEGTTVNPGQVNTDTDGNFRTTYAIAALNPQDSSIQCDATHDCVLWVGTDYNNAFTSGPHAFSNPFAVSGPSVTSSSTTQPSTEPSLNAGASAQPNPGGTSKGAPAPGTLATTGAPGLLLGIVGVGILTVLAGGIGRRWTSRRARST